MGDASEDCRAEELVSPLSLSFGGAELVTDNKQYQLVPAQLPLCVGRRASGQGLELAMIHYDHFRAFLIFFLPRWLKSDRSGYGKIKQTKTKGERRFNSYWAAVFFAQNVFVYIMIGMFVSYLVQDLL